MNDGMRGIEIGASDVATIDYAQRQTRVQPDGRGHRVELAGGSNQIDVKRIAITDR